MDCLFYNIKDKYILVYLDNINIFSTTFEEHLEHLKEILERFRQANLKLNMEKCHLCQKELTFLGHTISAEGILSDPTKVNKVKNFAVLTNLTELRGFIGLASYYCHFIQDFSLLLNQ